MPPAGAAGGRSLFVASAPPSFPLPSDNIFFRFLHLARINKSISRKATPARPPTTLPAITDVEGGEDPEPFPAPAASVLEGDAPAGATPVAALPAPPPSTPVTAAVDEVVEPREVVAEAEEEEKEEYEVEFEEGSNKEVEVPDKEEELEGRYVSEDLEEVEEVVEFEFEFEKVKDELLELGIKGAMNVLVWTGLSTLGTWKPTRKT
jgi:hypothetical protein